MKFWIRTCILLCLYGFFKELRPSEPFLTEYLLGPYHNLTESQVYYDVYPVWTYSYLSLLVVVFLCTDLLRYKPVIVFEGIGYVATWCLLLWARDVHWMQLMEFCYGIATSTEVAYFTYMYAQVDGEYYQKITSYTRSAILAGRCFSGIFAQVLYSTGAMDYHSLNYFSLTSVSVALGISFFLPPVRRSIYFHREPPSDAEEMTVKGLPEKGEKDLKDPPAAGEKGLKDLSSGGGKGVESAHNIARDKNSFLKRFKQVCILLWTDFQEAYSNKTLVKWSVWWAFATCINFQVGNYIQPLWESIFPFQDSETLYNGAVEATSTFLGAAAAFGVGYLHLNWTLVGELTLAVISLLDAVLLVLMGLTAEIWVAYINYIVFRVSYQVLITVASFQVAKELKAESYGLVFGLNMFLALLIQTILTLVVIEWLQIEPGAQFVIYGCYFALLSLLFFVISSYQLGSLGWADIRRRGLWERDTSPMDRNDAPVGTTEIY